MALEIISHQEKAPEERFAEGPVLAIVRNVEDALGYLDGTTSLENEGDG